MAIRKYRKLFYDLDAANSFGKEVNMAATAPDFMVPAGAMQQLRSVFEVGTSDGDYFFLDEERSRASGLPVYYVNYRMKPPSHSSTADVLAATQNAIAYLEEKYAALGPGPYLDDSALGR